MPLCGVTVNFGGAKCVTRAWRRNQMANRGARGLAAILALVALSAGPATALDGEVLINQNKANAGGITPNDDPGFPVTLSQSGKYKLTGNLNVPAGRNGINVTANYVTIDLNGFRIFGADQAIVGIKAANRDGLTVMNGTVSGFTSHGIETRAFAIIQDMQITNNGGFGIKLVENGRVLRSTISENTSDGVFCLSRCLIAQNVIARQSAGVGVGLQTDAGGHLVLGNVISGNAGFAIYAEGVTGFAHNTVTGNGVNPATGSSIVGAVLHVHPNICQTATCP
jgi:hypothetical protein